MKRDDEDKQINYDPMANMPHMYDGAIVGDYGVDSGGSDTFKGAPVSTDRPVSQDPGESAAPFMQGAAEKASQPVAPEFAADLGTSHPDTPVPAVIKDPRALTQRSSLPGMPQDVTPDALQAILGDYKAGTEKYGPEQQLAVQNALIKARTSPGMALASGAAGLGDAIMQGVARAGPSHFQENLQNQGNRLADETMSTMQNAQTGKMAQIQAQMKLTMDDPRSPLSKVVQNSQRPTLKKLGWTDDQINQTSANTISEATKNGLGFYESQQTAGLKKATIEQTGEYQKRMVENTADQRRTDRDKAIIGGSTIPFVGPSHVEKQAAFQRLEGGGNPQFSPDVMAYSQRHGITPEQAQAQKDRRMKGQ